MNHCCASMKNKTMGIITITDPAICNPYSVAYCPAKLATATGRVYMLSSVEIINGHRKLFHEPVKLRMPKVARAGLHRGNTIRLNVKNSPLNQPSSFQKLVGKGHNELPHKKIPGLAMPAARAYVAVEKAQLLEKTGIMVICPGTISVPRIL